MERIENESIRLFCPAFADELVRREAFERLQPASETVSGDEIDKMRSQLVMCFVEVPFHGGFLDGAVHALDLTIGPRMLRLRQSMINVVARASVFERMRPEQLPPRHHVFDLLWRPRVSPRIREVNAVVREDRVDLVRNGSDERMQEIAGDPSCRLLVQFYKSEP